MILLTIINCRQQHESGRVALEGIYVSLIASLAISLSLTLSVAFFVNRELDLESSDESDAEIDTEVPSAGTKGKHDLMAKTEVSII